MDIVYIRSSPSNTDVTINVNPAIRERLAVYNLSDILRLFPETITLELQIPIPVFAAAPAPSPAPAPAPVPDNPEEPNDPDGANVLIGDNTGNLHRAPELVNDDATRSVMHELFHILQNRNLDANVCDIHGMSGQDPRADPTSLRIKQFLGETAYNRVTPGIKAMAHFEARLHSYNRLVDANSMIQSIPTLCEAGFVYIGDGLNDAVVCFCCMYGLKNWEQDDDPWVEHAIWFPKCTFLLLKKGKPFVDACAVERVNREINLRVIEYQRNGARIVGNYNGARVVDDQVVDDQHNGAGVDDVDNGAGVADAVDERPGIDVGPNERPGIDVGPNERPGIDVGPNERPGLIDYIDNQLINNSQEDADVPPAALPEEPDFEESRATLCKICLREKVETVAIPCGHAVACIPCSVCVDQCAVCRSTVTKCMRVYPYFDEELDKFPYKLKRSPNDENPDDPILCKICHNAEMNVAVLPCRHISACFECSVMMEKCPVCDESFFALLQVFLS